MTLFLFGNPWLSFTHWKGLYSSINMAEPLKAVQFVDFVSYAVKVTSKPKFGIHCLQIQWINVEQASACCRWSKATKERTEVGEYCRVSYLPICKRARLIVTRIYR